MSAPAATKRLLRELADWRAEPLPGCTAIPIGDDLNNWMGSVTGPPDSPYAGGKFGLAIHFPPEFPFVAPKIIFTTKVFHPNVSTGCVVQLVL